MNIKRHLNNFLRYKYLLFELVKKNIKLKYRRSYLGILWTLVEPLLTMIVLTLVFGTLFGKDDRTYPVYILCGRLLYSFFSSASIKDARVVTDGSIRLRLPWRSARKKSRSACEHSASSMPPLTSG